MTDIQTALQPETSEKHTCKAIIKRLVPNLYEDIHLKPSQFIKKFWQKYCADFASNQSINGKVFEELIAISLIRSNILPFYMQAKVAFIPYVNYDFIVYTSDIGPISLSAKTSLRERWKQADLEAVALKYIHRKSKSFVITMDAEAVRVRRIDESQALGLDGFVLADTTEYDSMIEDIRLHQLSLSPKVEVVSSNFVVTHDNAEAHFS